MKQYPQDLMSETVISLTFETHLKICTKGGKAQERTCGVLDPKTLGKHVDSGSVRLPLILLLTVLEASGASL